MRRVIVPASTLLLLFASTAWAASASPNPAAPVYWCPKNTPDQLFSASPAPGCVPLAEKEDSTAEEPGKDPKPKKERDPIRIDSVQTEVSQFLSRYRDFLTCCAADIDSVPELEDLEGDARHLLKSIQDLGLVNMQTNQRGMTVRALVAPVARAKDDLGTLKKRLKKLNESYDKADRADYETADRERRQIQDAEEGITKEFRPTVPPSSAKTGTEIGDTSLPNRFGTSLGGGNTPAGTLPTATGTDIGSVVSPSSDPQTDLRLRRGLDTQDSSITPRHGPAFQDTSLPNSTGFEIGTPEGPMGPSGTVPRAGPDIGDSSLNRR